MHCTEGWDADHPHLILEVPTTPATIPEGEIMENLHERLAENQLLPSQHLVDKGSVDAELIAASVNPSTRLISLDLCSPILHTQCTHTSAKVLILRPDEQSSTALQQARQRQETPEFRALYATRAGIEGTVAQSVRTCEIRRSRSIGLKKLKLQAFLTATSLHLLRACQWVADANLSATPFSRFAKLIASLEQAEAA